MSAVGMERNGIAPKGWYCTSPIWRNYIAPTGRHSPARRVNAGGKATSRKCKPCKGDTVPAGIIQCRPCRADASLAVPFPALTRRAGECRPVGAFRPTVGNGKGNAFHAAFMHDGGKRNVFHAAPAAGDGKGNVFRAAFMHDGRKRNVFRVSYMIDSAKTFQDVKSARRTVRRHFKMLNPLGGQCENISRC